MPSQDRGRSENRDSSHGELKGLTVAVPAQAYSVPKAPKVAVAAQAAICCTKRVSTGG